MKLVVFALLSAACAAAQTGKPDDPCRKANTQHELNECTEKKFHAADDEMQKLYRVISAQLDDHLAKQSDPNSPENKYAAAAVSDLKAAQQAWITYRDLQCKAEAGQEAGGSIQSTVLAMCMETLTRARTQQLHDIYDEK